MSDRRISLTCLCPISFWSFNIANLFYVSKLIKIGILVFIYSYKAYSLGYRHSEGNKLAPDRYWNGSIFWQLNLNKFTPNVFTSIKVTHDLWIILNWINFFSLFCFLYTKYIYWLYFCSSIALEKLCFFKKKTTNKQTNKQKLYIYLYMESVRVSD